MSYRSTVFMLTLILAAFVAIPAFSNTIGFNYSQAVDDTAWGAHGDYEKTVGQETRLPIDFEVEGQLQQSGDVYVGNADLSAQFNISAIGVKLSSLNNLQGPSIAGLGRQNTLDAALVVPVGDLDFAIGVFGQQGNPFAPQYELSDPLDPLSEILETEAGITIPEGNRWGVSTAVGFDISRFEVDAKALLDPNNITHQGRVGVGTGGELWGNLGWSAKANFALQSHKADDAAVVEIQTDTIIGIDYKF